MDALHSKLLGMAVPFQSKVLYQNFVCLSNYHQFSYLYHHHHISVDEVFIFPINQSIVNLFIIHFYIFFDFFCTNTIVVIVMGILYLDPSEKFSNIHTLAVAIFYQM